MSDPTREDGFHGACYALFAYDLAFSIDLGAAERRITDAKQRDAIKHRRRAPTYFRYQPPPLRITRTADALLIGEFHTNAVIEIIIYDFGAASVVYTVPLSGSIDRLLRLSQDLYENPILLDDSRRRVEQILETLEGAVVQPHISTFVEDYVIYHLAEVPSGWSIPNLAAGSRQALARILRAEDRELSEDEVQDALSHRISYGIGDVTIIDWNAAIVADREADDTLAVLEFANVELMEMRRLDDRLDQALARAYETLTRRSWGRFPFGFDPSALDRLAQWQVDSAILFEGVNNALKLIGDQYLARLYRLGAERFHLAEWDSTILRKIETLDGIYSKISDQVSAKRMELLEWIIIALIAFSIVLPFLF